MEGAESVITKAVNITLECDTAFQPIRTQESGQVIKVNDIGQYCVFSHIFLLDICAKI